MRQSAAIPFRLDPSGQLWVLLVTSRTRRRWIIPKGKVGLRMLARRSAEREAFEEAGVLGRMWQEPVGHYWQGEEALPPGDRRFKVHAYPLEVTDELPAWREMHERERRWFPIQEALQAVTDPEIRKILRAFNRSLRRPGNDN
jgi:8-oxo-dGTP pyrophosphatase MutT (NUDIX family)